MEELWKAQGKIIGIPSFQNSRPALLCGEGLPTRVLASVGLTYGTDDIDAELEKASSAVEAGAEIITDHSVAGDIASFHRQLVDTIQTPISYLTVYELIARHKGEIAGFDKNEALDLIEEQISRGITLLTVHATATLEATIKHSTSRRRIVSTSRGGAIIASILRRSQKENVYWEHFEEILKIASRHRVVLSLGSTYRPASVCDAGMEDILYWDEILRMSTLVKMAIEQQLPIMVEGIGHAPINAMPEIISRSKAICHGVPYRVLTVATDAALGNDHIAGAIAIAIAAMNGADLATCVTRSEHVGRPTREEIIEAVIAARIAAHCGDLGKGGDSSMDAKMSSSRILKGCKGLAENSIHPASAMAALKKHYNLIANDDVQCSMCGDTCALRQDVNRLK